ncbi:hypothetical protein MPH_06234 [Macrophomina phaseolina MS6]|uniref:Chitin-binding type-1 domain-containing protein n=1 Tax=Macrophomina phaseolina (strain MS6) TaxID=1126212 RepID=K2RNZ9_MACPH|nr:hypothetical protein MPH_06234 [Macrophomina phaseolina MS6]
MPSLSFQLLLLALCTATASAQMSSANAIPVSAITLPWADPSSTSSSNAFSSSPSNAANASSPSSSSFPSASGNASATTTGKYPTTTDNSCGAEVNRMCLITGVNPCCSGDGFCGNTPDYCGSACQSDYGACGTNVSASTTNSTLGNPACSWAGEGTSPRCDGRCGSEYNNAICSSEAGPDDFVAYGVFGYGPCCR